MAGSNRSISDGQGSAGFTGWLLLVVGAGMIWGWLGAGVVVLTTAVLVLAVFFLWDRI